MAEEIIEQLHRDPGPDPHAGAMGRIIDRLGIVFAIGLLVAAAILVVEIFLRYVLNAPTVWAHETVIFLTASAFVYGGLYAVARNAHIRVVLIYDFLSPRLRRLFDVAISITCFLATAMFTWAAWKGVQRAIWTPAGDFRLETSGSAWNPPTPGLLKLFLLGILVVMTVQFAVLSLAYLRKKDD
ncbi:TRAP transporter small permease subunit [Sulfitobacter sp. S190]|uniref:TRAP transporter small permease subunit n=1 Tax=Sulfitobacter sp. S190 TaxID=2867022 RepID=UPI0021A3EBB0|nr:TRAP transporter small permease [Sulfitobacter sp. S190]UWR21980.1 TRAP transporter small permease [Sulfitobacter sp. S190]